MTCLTPPTSPSADAGETSATGVIASCPSLIIDAYFATKVVTETAGMTTVALNRIQTHVLGRVLYVVVETRFVSSGERVTISFRTNDTRLTGVVNQVFRVTDGSADVESFTGRVGDTSALNDNTGACAYSNLYEFASKAIFKISLRPHARADFDACARNIRSARQNLPSIRVDVSPVGWLDISFLMLRPSLTLENKKVYEIYHKDNTYNFLPARVVNRRTVRKKISHIENGYTDYVRYYFFNRLDNTHTICEVTQTSVRARGIGQKISPTSIPQRIPRGHVESASAPPRGDAAMNYYYNLNPRDTQTRTPRWQYDSIVSVGTLGAANDYGIRRYDALPNTMAELIRMPEALNYDAESGQNRVLATFTYRNTARRSCNPRAFAGFLGVLIQLGRNDVVCTGVCFDDATSYPSVTHPNGDSVDTAYLGTLVNEQHKVDAFVDYYYTDMLRGREGWRGSLQRSEYAIFHEDHLHAGNFDVNQVVVLNR